MSALVAVKLCLCGTVCGAPYGITVLDVIKPSAYITGNIVITISGDSSELCVTVEAVAAGGVGNKSVKAVIP